MESQQQMNHKEKISAIIGASIFTKQQIMESAPFIEKIEHAASLIAESLENGHKLLFCGNGGSAADAQHLAAEFSGRFYKDRKAWPAEALHVNTSYLTAVANDYHYDVVYSRLIEGIGRPGDVLVALSTSGNSRNIVNAIEMARSLGIKVIGLTGSTGGEMLDLCAILLNVPSTDTPRIQEAHIMIGHIICQLVEEVLTT
jgi:D-sedoheptulose 7-phosphate isomerase